MPTIANIAVFTPLMKTFDYLLPEDISSSNLQNGMRVLVPFGKQKKVGIFLAFAKDSSVPADKLKPIFERNF